MAFQVSPGINVSEIDLTAGAKTVSVSDAGFAGPFQWGPALEVRSIDSEDQLVRVFGKPDDTISTHWFAAQSFLAYSNLLRCVRALSADALNATGDAKLLASSVKATNGTTLWTNTDANFLSSSLVPGQKVLIGGTQYTVANTPTNSTFNTVETIPVKTFPTNLSVTSGQNTATLTNVSITNAQTIFQATQTLYINSVTFTVYSVTPTTLTFTTQPAFTCTSIVAVGTNYVANTVEYYGTKITNADNYDVTYSSGVSGLGWAAKWAGELGNSLKVGVCASNAAFWSNNTTGTITLNQNSTTVGGSGTAFLTELVVGDYIVVGGRSYKVVAIASNESLTIETPATVVASASGGAWARKWEYHNQFDRAPGTSTYAANRGGSADEMHIVVVDEDGAFTGTPGTVLERYAFVSKGSDGKTNNGEGNYYVNVINRDSDYIWWLEHPTSVTTGFGTTVVNTTFGAATLPVSQSLWGGQTDNVGVVDADLMTAYDLFDNTDTVDVSLIIAGPASATLASYLITNIAEVRKDCLVLCSPTYASCVNNAGGEVVDIATFRNSLPSSSYGVLDSGWKYTYDKWNDKYRWVPLNGDIAGLAARSDTQTDPWFSPAGFTRGQIKNVVKLAWNPKQQDRDDLYKIGVNPVVSFPSQGVVLYGDKTLLDRPSAFDRINVRRLFIILEKTIARLARTQLFEFNDEFTRSQFRNIVEPYLRDVKARRGVVDYRVICDDTNNTAEVIEQNRFVGDIFVKPARAINFIQLNFVAVRSGVSFQEVVGVI